MKNGNLICPKCFYEGMEIYQKPTQAVTLTEKPIKDMIDVDTNGFQFIGKFKCWEAKKQYESNIIVWKFIFYYSSNFDFRPECCAAYDACHVDWRNAGWFCKIMLGLIYISFFLFVVDIIKFLICGVDHFYKLVFGLYKQNNTILAIDKVEKKIWDLFDGLSEKSFNLAYIAKCYNCKFQPDSVINFIQIQVGAAVGVGDTKNKDKKKNNVNMENMITFNFHGTQVDYPICCEKTTIFSEAINELKEFHIDLFQNKNLVFSFNGGTLDQNKTIEELQIKNHSNVLIMEFDQE